MSEYINKHGQVIKLTEYQATKIEEILHLDGVELSSIPIGGTFKIYNHEFVVLDQGGELAAVILKDVLGFYPFSSTTNNYDGSNADDICNNFAEQLSSIIGEDNILSHIVNLTANDGLTDYGTINRKVSLLTADQYRKYVYILDKFKPNCSWFLATAYSTPEHGYTYAVMCVTEGGSVGNEAMDSFCGIRPYCVLKSNIFVNK